MKLGTVLNALALRHPERPAAVSALRRINYGELDQRSDRLANALAARGVGIGDGVALHLENSVEFVETLFGIAKAGAIAVLVNTRLTAPEIAHIVATSRPKLFLFDPARREIARDATRDMRGLTLVASRDAGEDELGLPALIEEGAPSRPPRLPADVDDLFHLYTSGTTGTPKGVVRTHSAFFIQHGLVGARQWDIRSGDKVLVVSPMVVGTGLARLGDALCGGGTLVILPKFDAAHVVDMIEREGVTVVGMVPTVVRMMLPKIRLAPERLRSLRVMLATGEPFPVELKRELLALLPDLRLNSFYAMTEVGAVTNLGPEEQLTHPASVGRVTPGIEVKIVDNERREVATGETGELAVRSGAPGRYLTMRGYLDPAANAELMQDGWIFTGDMGCFDRDGYLHLVERKKDMILSGGFNIYPREVELALLKHPSVHDAAVVGGPDAIYGESVVAFVELKPGLDATETELIAHCKELIASYKKPKRVLFRALPRNSTGKVMKQALREELARSAAPAK